MLWSSDMLMKHCVAYWQVGPERNLQHVQHDTVSIDWQHVSLADDRISNA